MMSGAGFTTLPSNFSTKLLATKEIKI